MSAIGSVSTAASVLRRNPTILLVGVLFVALSEVTILLDVYVGPMAQLLAYPLSFLVTPFLLGGIITLIDEGLDGSTQLGSFVRGGKENYVSMLGATVLFGLIVIGASVVSGILLVIVGVGTAAGGGGALGIGIGVVFLSVSMTLLMMFLQFYDAAIVVSDAQAIESIPHSVRLVWNNFISVVGFSIVFFVSQLIGQGPGIALFLSAVEVTETGETVIASESTLYLSIAVTIVLGTVMLAYAYTYFITYYRSILEDESPSSSVTAD
ncbi:DUF7847 domain-containing protein [Natronobacterium gregoryi]|uniref:DUF7847 domain-containing protein n=2 Tax=Natronobacterium gregoryi TaxID=44930 RepID=L0ALQ1_NATGS|nr:hypothetical protein [Natronobacterium gregoryi]AFZ74823.1 hypothetical protein Natgr_3717 [Natronobacterium gregoryi SP2]ELY66156.1 hypothetical protein C490_13369 [Natronobacterium gregoryi SP2]PLK19471.1 hypothetical protein CYV19_14515 [Natronobacterium gregoryi SP2]SFJ43771.1 hypothetical protein SAMN05443661_12941 [Natronobacterium gregoryi]